MWQEVKRTKAVPQRPDVLVRENRDQLQSYAQAQASEGPSRADLEDIMTQRMQQQFLDHQIPAAENEADRLAANAAGAQTMAQVKAQMGEAMGADFSGVRFHTGPDAANVADQMGALAYTTGRDVYFGQGGFNPTIAAHELVHTAQQGSVASTMETVSAPAGEVQMKLDLRRRIGNLGTLISYGAGKVKEKVWDAFNHAADKTTFAAVGPRGRASGSSTPTTATTTPTQEVTPTTTTPAQETTTPAAAQETQPEKKGWFTRWREKMAARIKGRGAMNNYLVDNTNVPSRTSEIGEFQGFGQVMTPDGSQRLTDVAKTDYMAIRGISGNNIYSAMKPVTRPIQDELSDYFGALEANGFSYEDAIKTKFDDPNVPSPHLYGSYGANMKYNDTTIAATRKILEMYSAHLDSPEMKSMMSQGMGLTTSFTGDLQAQPGYDATKTTEEIMDSRFIKDFGARGMIPQPSARTKKGHDKGPKDIFLTQVGAVMQGLETMKSHPEYFKDFPELLELQKTYEPIREKILANAKGQR